MNVIDLNNSMNNSFFFFFYIYSSIIIKMRLWPGMHYSTLLAQISHSIQRLPVGVVVFPEEAGEGEVQLDIQLIHQPGDVRVAHQREQEAPLHRGTIGKSMNNRQQKRDDVRNT